MNTRFLSLFVLPLIAAAAPAVRSDMLVSTDWLAQHLNDPKIVILQVSRDRTAYDAGHIPGARFLGLADLVVTRNGILNELPPTEALKSVFERVGVSDDSRIILYGDAAVLPATRAYFTLDYLGHGDATALLDGGLPKWKGESRPLVKDAPEAKQGRFTPRLHPQVLAEMPAVQNLSQSAPSAAVLLDVRTTDEFHGTPTANAEIPRPGHIPGAANIYWMQSQASKDDMSLLSAPELRKLYEAAGVSEKRPVVTYCNTGMQATQSYFTLKYLGYDVKMYDGSFSEWSEAKTTAVEK